MRIFTRYFEIELHTSLLYVRLGALDACLARDALGWLWAFGSRASFIA